MKEIERIYSQFEDLPFNDAIQELDKFPVEDVRNYFVDSLIYSVNYDFSRDIEDSKKNSYAPESYTLMGLKLLGFNLDELFQYDEKFNQIIVEPDFDNCTPNIKDICLVEIKDETSNLLYDLKIENWKEVLDKLLEEHALDSEELYEECLKIADDRKDSDIDIRNKLIRHHMALRVLKEDSLAA